MAAGWRTYEEYQSYLDRFHSCSSACGMARRVYAVYHSGHLLSPRGRADGMAWCPSSKKRRRKGAQKEYEDTVRRYTGTTMMKVVWIEESADERWEHQKDGSDRLRRETVYLPTYEYAVNGRTYQYASRQALSSKRDLRRQVMGYYDPAKPERITENRPRRPVLGGIGFFVFSAFLLWFGIMTFTGQVAIS